MRDRQHRAAARHGDEAREIANGLRSIQAKSGHNLARIWDDWISSMALAIANKCDRRPAAVIRGMDTDLPFDLLGSVYMALELGSSYVSARRRYGNARPLSVSPVACSTPTACGS